MAEQRYKAILAVIGDGRTLSEVASDWGVCRRNAVAEPTEIGLATNSLGGAMAWVRGNVAGSQPPARSEWVGRLTLQRLGIWLCP